MAGDLTRDTEVGARADKPRAEDFLPEAVDRRPAGEGMIGQQQPAGEAEAVARRPLREAGEDGGGVGLDLVQTLVVLAAGEHEGLRHLRLFVHDMGHRPAAADLRLLGVEGRGLGRGGLEGLVGCGKPPVIERAGRGGAGGGIEADDVGKRLASSEPIDLAVGKRPAPHGKPRQAAGVGRGAGRPAADRERHLVPDRVLLEGVRLDVQSLELAVVEDLDPLGAARAVIGDRDLRPGIGGELILGRNLHRVVRPGMDHVHAEAAALDPSIPAAVGVGDVHPGDDGIGGVIGRRADPEGEAEALVLFEVAEARQFGCLAVEEEPLGAGGPGLPGRLGGEGEVAVGAGELHLRDAPLPFGERQLRDRSVLGK